MSSLKVAPLTLCLVDSYGPVTLLEQEEAYATISYEQAKSEGYLIDLARHLAFKHPSFKKTINPNKFFFRNSFYFFDTSRGEEWD